MSRITEKIILVSVLILLFSTNSMAETKSDAKAHKEQGDLIKFEDSQELGPYKVRVLEIAKGESKKVGYNVFICQFEIKNIHKEQTEIEIDPEKVKVIASTGEKYGPPFGGALDLDIGSAYIEGKLKPDISSAMIINGRMEVRKIGRDSRFTVLKEEGKERWFILPSKESPTKFAIFFMTPKDIQLKELHWEGLKPFSLQTSTVETKSDARAHKEQGAAYTMEGEYDKAIEEFSKAISLDPRDAETYIGRGFVYRRNGQYDKAIEDFNIAIKLDPKAVDAVFNRGHCHVEKGQYEKAIEDFSKAISLNPTLSEAYNNRGLCYRKLGNNEKAMKDYTKAIEVDPKNGEAYNNRGVIHITSGNIEKAITDFQKACDYGSDKGCRNLQRAKQER